MVSEFKSSLSDILNVGSRVFTAMRGAIVVVIGQRPFLWQQMKRSARACPSFSRVGDIFLIVTNHRAIITRTHPFVFVARPVLEDRGSCLIVQSLSHLCISLSVTICVS